MISSLLSLLLATTIQATPLQTGITIGFYDDSTLLRVSPVPIQTSDFEQAGALSAYSIMVLDVDSNTAMYSKLQDDKVSIASVTKLMTAAVVLAENNPSELVTVSPKAGAEPGSRMGLYYGDTLTVNDLLHGLLIQSGNDAAIALAEHNAGSVEAFVEKMNTKASELGLTNTHYVNPTGLDSTVAFSSARDVAILAAHLIKDPSVRAIAQMKEATITSQEGRVYELETTNELLGENGIHGLKTGKTPVAGECLVSLAQTPSGHEVITVVLGSEDRFGETTELVNWIYNSFSW